MALSYMLQFPKNIGPHITYFSFISVAYSIFLIFSLRFGMVFMDKPSLAK